MSGMNPDRRETESQASNHPLESYVSKSITRLERIFSTERRSSETAEDARELLSWWRETKILLNMHVSENQLMYRLRSAMAQKSLSPFFEAHLTDEQYKRLTTVFNEKYKQIIELIERFGNGPGLQTEHSVVKAELEDAKEAMRTLYVRTYVPGRRNVR